MSCKGCGTSRADNHCQYPSNPIANAEANGNHRAPKSADPVIVARRERAAAIRRRNQKLN